MSKSEQDIDFFAPQTDNQQVVFDYLESLLEDPETLAHDTMEELKAIGALERREPAEVEPVAESDVDSETVAGQGGAAVEPEAPSVSDLIEGPVDEILLEEEDLSLVDDADDAFVLEDTPADLLDDTAEEPFMDAEPAGIEEDTAMPGEPEAAIDSNAAEYRAVPEPELALAPATSVETAAPSGDPAASAPALHVADGVLNCILFQLQGLTLALPVDDVEGAVSLERLTLHLDLEHDWVLGTFSAMGKETSVVDTGSWLLPGRFDAAQASYDEVLILKGRRWALACDTLVKSLRMQHRDIVWAGENTSRPWLLGTNMSERCAILDVEKLQALLDRDA